MNPTINQVVMNLLEATVTLYPAKADGSPQLDAPIWTGAAAERLQARANWLREDTRPSAAKYPRRHPLVAQYKLEIGRVWLLDSVISPNGYAPDHRQYVLDVVWVNEDTQQWHRKTFYGVTICDQEWQARDIESGLMEEQTFDAQYFVPSSGDGTVPAINPTLPLWVQYTDASGASLLLYNYDPDTKTFTAQADTGGRATIGYSAGAFGIQFAGDSQPVVATSGTASQTYRSAAAYRSVNTYRQMMLIVNGGVFTGVAAPASLPRLDFYYGNQRVFTVTREGVYDLDFTEGSPDSVPAGGFGITGGGGALVAVALPGSLTATQFQVIN
jgi:hypothetical protein